MLEYPTFSLKLVKLILLKSRRREGTELYSPNYDVLIIKTQFFFTVANITKKLPEKKICVHVMCFLSIYITFLDYKMRYFSLLKF